MTLNIDTKWPTKWLWILLNFLFIAYLKVSEKFTTSPWKYRPVWYVSKIMLYRRCFLLTSMKFSGSYNLEIIKVIITNTVSVENLCIIWSNFYLARILLSWAFDMLQKLGICGSWYSRMAQVNFKGCVPQILLGSFLNTLTQVKMSSSSFLPKNENVKLDSMKLG